MCSLLTLITVNVVKVFGSLLILIMINSNVRIWHNVFRGLAVWNCSKNNSERWGPEFVKVQPYLRNSVRGGHGQTDVDWAMAALMSEYGAENIRVQILITLRN